MMSFHIVLFFTYRKEKEKEKKQENEKEHHYSSIRTSMVHTRRTKKFIIPCFYQENRSNALKK